MTDRTIGGTVPGLRLGVVLCAGAAAITYSAFLLAPVVRSRLPISSTFPSELEAIGQPHAAWFRAADAVSGLLIVVAVMGARRLGTVGDQRVGVLAVALTGVSSMTDALTTIGCAPSTSAACRSQDGSVGGLFTQLLDAHTLSGLAGFLGAAVGMVSIGFAVRSRNPSWARASITVGLVLAGLGLIDLALLYMHGPFGLAERARDAMVSVWLLGLAAATAAPSSAYGVGVRREADALT